MLAGKPEGKRPLIRLGIDGRIILKWISENRVGGCINLTENRDWWWAVVNIIMNLLEIS